MSIADKLITIANNTSAVAEVVNASRATVSGENIFVDDVLDVEHALQIQTEPGTEVKIYGKNLFGIDDFIEYANTISKGNTNDNYLGEECFSYANYRSDTTAVMLFNGKENTRYTFSLEFSFKYGNNTTYKNMAIFYVKYTDGTNTSFVANADTNTFTKVVATTAANKTIMGIGISRFSSSATIYIKKNIQMEEGTVATDYEPYTDQVATADEDGKVEGLKSVSPTMTVMSSNSGHVVTCEYFPQSASDTYSKYQRIKTSLANLKDSL